MLSCLLQCPRNWGMLIYGPSLFQGVSLRDVLSIHFDFFAWLVHFLLEQHSLTFFFGIDLNFLLDALFFDFCCCFLDIPWYHFWLCACCWYHCVVCVDGHGNIFSLVYVRRLYGHSHSYDVSQLDLELPSTKIRPEKSCHSSYVSLVLHLEYQPSVPYSVECLRDIQRI